MGINQMNVYGSSVQNYLHPAASTREKEDLTLQEKQQENSSITEDKTHAASDLTPKDKKDARLEDISLTFQKQDSFGYIGKDSDIRSLDMEKAISDRKKDKVLQQYQYFVGNSKSFYESVDGTMIQKF